MKKCKLMIAALLTVSSLNGFANGKETAAEVATPSTTILNIERASDKVVYRLVYQSKVQGFVKVFIYNAQGDLLLQDRILNRIGFSRPYNFNALPIGKYTLKIEDASGKVTKSIYHGEDSLSESAKENSLLVKVKAIENSSKCELRVIGTLEAPIQVKIYDVDGSVVFSEEITESTSFSKIYDFSKIGLKHMTIEVLNASRILESTTF